MKTTSKKQEIKNGECKYLKICDFCGNGFSSGASSLFVDMIQKQEV